MESACSSRSLPAGCIKFQANFNKTKGVWCIETMVSLFEISIGIDPIRYTSMNELYDIILRTNRAWKNVVVNVVALIIGQRTEVGPRSN